MYSRLSRLLGITASQQWHSPNFTESDEGLAFDETAAGPVGIIEHDPALTAHDTAIFLLHTAAEVEHSLMIQYLFAAYSLKPAGLPPEKDPLPADKQALVDEWRKTIISIAAEEMGHLAGVQNLLHFLGGPLNFEREDFPFRNGLYPFRFRLEPLTKNSLAKYVYAEMPEGLTGDDVEEIKNRAMEANMDDSLVHVGYLYQSIINLFNLKNADGTYVLTDFAEDSVPFQIDESWRGANFVLNTVKSRAEAIKLLDDIAKQGEGLELTENTLHSHYWRFRKIYDAFPEEDDWEPSLHLAYNPNTNQMEDIVPDSFIDVILTEDLNEGRITNSVTRLWAQLLNLRYRMLLTDISHALHLNINTEAKKRQILQDWAFDEMFISSNIRTIANFLTQMPLRNIGENSELCAGPTFELPYTLNLPAADSNRWRVHRDMINASLMLIKKILTDSEPETAQRHFLESLAERDRLALIKTEDPEAVPPPPEPGDNSMNRFTEVKKILENAVGNVTIGRHGNFWRDKTRDQFVDLPVFGSRLFAKKADGTFDENESNLIKALEGRAPFGSDIGTPGGTRRRMPAGLPPVPQDKIDFIRNWIKDGCPDDVGAMPPPEGLSFETDVKILFRDVPDRQVMLAMAGFDLHKFEDVRDRADLILARLEDGSMPCDSPWSEEKLAVLRQWITDGKNP